MKVAICPVTPFRQNACVIWDPETMVGALTDPGGEKERLLEVAEKQGVKLEKILVTHGHMDHAGAVLDISEELGIPIEGPQKEETFWLDRLDQQGERYGMTARTFTPDRWLEDGDEVTVGSMTLGVRHCPGHTPGHIIFFHEPSRLAIVGDVIFHGSVGRTDFPRGNHKQLITSIREKLWPLGDDMTFVPGHGQTSTFGNERKMNPYCSDFVEI